MVFEHQGDYPSQWAAIGEIAEKLGVHRETFRVWVRRAEVDGGHSAGVTTEERERIKQLEREKPRVVPGEMATGQRILVM